MPSYNRLNEYLKKKYGGRTLKICINGGFTCPNRDGTKGTSGCIFCLNGGSLIKDNSLASISNQIKSFLSSYKGERADRFIAYFQEYTNTYGDIETLKKKYDEALNASDKFVLLDIDTRCDCINEDIAKLLASYKNKVDVCVELGLQTSSNSTHAFINQNITNEDCINSVNLLKKYGIECVIHLMVDLPYETHINLVESVKFINSLKPNGIKIHNTYVLKGTKLGELYQKGIYSPISQDEYIDEVIYILTHLDPEIVIHRLVGDSPTTLLLGPTWAKNKKQIMNEINNVMEQSNLFQGIYFSK